MRAMHAEERAAGVGEQQLQLQLPIPSEVIDGGSGPSKPRFLVRMFRGRAVDALLGQFGEGGSGERRACR